MVKPDDVLHAKILIVDDLEANVLLLEQMLRNAGYDQVSSTSDPTQVCERHLVNRYDLILLDLQMPTMDGFEVMENLKQIEPDGYLPVLVITAQPEHKLKALKAGARDFVSKPFDLAEVLLRVRNLAETRLLHLKTRTLYERVVAEQKVSQKMLHDMLPAAVLERLQRRPGVTADLITGSYAEVILLFADLLDFAKFSEGAGAVVLAGVLEDLSNRLDAGAARAEVIDGAWLAAADLPDEAAGKTVRAAQKAVDLKAALDRFNAVSHYKLQVRIGLDTAPSLALALAPKTKARRASPRK